MVPRWLVQVLHPPQKFERPPFWNAWRYGINKYGVEVIINGMTSLLNFIIIYQLVQKLLGGTHRQTGDLISLTFLFKESRLKKTELYKEINFRDVHYSLFLVIIHLHLSRHIHIVLLADAFRLSQPSSLPLVTAPLITALFVIRGVVLYLFLLLMFYFLLSARSKSTLFWLVTYTDRLGFFLLF
jgi:hypothetical protein